MTGFSGDEGCFDRSAPTLARALRLSEEAITAVKLYAVGDNALEAPSRC